MKKKIIIFCVAVASLSLMAFSFTNWNNSVNDQVETSSSKSVASDKKVAHTVNYMLYPDYPESYPDHPDFFYSVGTTNKKAGRLEHSDSTSYLTIVPEKQAVYVNGMDALIDYLKESNKKNTAIVRRSELKPGQLYFTVNKEGTISNVGLITTSGYPYIDKMLAELIANAPGEWEPAENSKGEKVDQKLILSFGAAGC